MNKKNGFTLFELLVTVSIIGILMAIASVSFSSAQKKGRDARRLEDMAAVQKAAESMYSLSTDYMYPANSASAWVIAGTGEVVLPAYPEDPKGDDYTQYTYTHPDGTNATYCACALVENTNSANSGANCNFGAASKTYYCVKNQQ